MADLAAAVQAMPSSKSLLDSKMRKRSSKTGTLVFLVAVLCGLGYICLQVAHDLDSITVTSVWPYFMLAVALTIALAFEFVNGFHDTANAVATVIYTHSLEPHIAVVLSGVCNLLGVLLSSGTVAFAIITLLPVELILKVSTGAGFSMVFALLIAAILWNLATWWFGLPASSSHTMVGSIMGVGLANQLINGPAETTGIDWDQAAKVLKALIVSPLVGFCCAALLLLFAKGMAQSRWRRCFVCIAVAAASAALTRTLTDTLWIVAAAGLGMLGLSWLIGIWLTNYQAIFDAPRGQEPPPTPIRAMMVLNCMGVSFAHGSNDGQKGMGLIMLILIGTIPAAYALNHDVSSGDVDSFVAASAQVESILERHIDPRAELGSNPQAQVADYLRSKQIRPDTVLALHAVIWNVNHDVEQYKTIRAIPPHEQANVRNDMYVAAEAIRMMEKSKNPAFTPAESAVLKTYLARLDKTTKFIPIWVKVAVALALGLGTMVGWKRIVITVGEKIGKESLTYAQGASAGLVAMGTIFAANTWSLPVSTTHILSSGVAGTMAANGSGIRFTTVRNIAAGWVLTLPAAALLSGLLYYLFHMFT